MHSFKVHSNESACIKSDRLGLEQVLYINPCIVLIHTFSDMKSDMKVIDPNI